MVNLDELQSALLGVDRTSAEMLTKPYTEVTSVDVSFLKKHQILRILWRRVVSPVQFYIGYAPPNSIFFLTGNPEAFIQMSRADKVSLASPDQALEYFSVFLEATRPANKLFYLVKGVDEIKWKKKLHDPEIARVDAIKKKYQSTIIPRVKKIGHRYKVNCFVMQDAELSKIQAFITASGTMELESKTVEMNLPSALGI